MCKEDYIKELFARYTDYVLVVNSYDEVLYANSSAVRFLCRLKRPGGYSPTVLRVFEGHYPSISLYDVVGDEINLEVNCTELVWQDQAAKLLIMSDRTEAVQRQRELEQMVYRDELTGLCNRRGLEQQTRKLIECAKSQQQKINVLFIDVNRLKKINDTLGHVSGDKALQETSAVIMQCLGENSVCARIGGDEFAVFQLVDPTHPFGDVIEHIEDKLEELNSRGDRLFELSLSIGMSQYSPEEKFDLARLLRQADRNMYLAKDGYDVVQLFSKLDIPVANKETSSLYGNG